MRIGIEKRKTLKRGEIKRRRIYQKNQMLAKVIGIGFELTPSQSCV
jgi:hypothetical protein